MCSFLFKLMEKVATGKRNVFCSETMLTQRSSVLSLLIYSLMEIITTEINGEKAEKDSYKRSVIE